MGAAPVEVTVGNVTNVTSQVHSYWLKGCQVAAVLCRAAGFNPCAHIGVLQMVHRYAAKVCGRVPGRSVGRGDFLHYIR